jgi:UDP-glucose 4-epimerase
VLDLPCLTEAVERVDIVFHLAANADVRSGLEHRHRDVEQNTLTTFNNISAEI